ncbi:MAG: ADP-ribosylglycohydrolase family protein [Methanobacteriota archaeon]
MQNTLSRYSPGARLFLGMAIGDAFGARFENLHRGRINLVNETDTFQAWNRYTDDTQMAIGVGELLISGKPFTRENLAQALLIAYKRDSRPGYSPLTRRMLEESPDGDTFLKSLPKAEIRERKSDGAAMRALPIGFLSEKEDVIRCATLNAEITHGHPDALAATAGIALIVHERYHTKTSFPEIMRDILYTIPHLTPQARDYLAGVIDAGWEPEIILGEYADYGVPYTESIILLGAVIAILTEFGEDPLQALLESVRLGGDTDTTACIVLGTALIYPGAEIPAPLLTGLEDGEYGQRYLIHIGDELNNRFP